MKINFKTLCACLALVTYAGITVAEGGNPLSYKDRGKSEPQTAAEWKTEAMKWKTEAITYKAKYKKLKNALMKELSASTDSLDSDNDSKSETKEETAPYKMTDEDWKKWSDAAKEGDIEVIRSFINKGVNIDGTTKQEGRTALWFAAWQFQTDIVKLLIEKGADVNFCDGYRSVLCVAVENVKRDNWNEDILDLLLSKGADPNKYGKLSYTPLMELAKSYKGDKYAYKVFKAIEKLLAKGADINLQDYKGKTALDYAEEQKNEKIAEFLRSKGAKKGSALKNENFESKQKSDNSSDQKSDFKKKTASYKMTDEDWNKCTNAAIKGYITVIQSFIDKGVSIDEIRRGAGPTLWYAAANCQTDIVRLLVNEGADVNFCKNTSVLCIAVENVKRDNWNEDILDLLLSKGADPNKYDKVNISSRTPLMALAGAYQADKSAGKALRAIKKLLAKGADINLEDYEGKTALDYAEKEQNKKIADFLKSKGAKKGSAQK